MAIEEKSPGVYEFTTHWATYPEVLKERMVLEEYQPEQGDVELERCATCDSPLLLRQCEWDLERGIITNRRNGYRMTILGPGLMDTVFEALEWELGETIPRAVVEAQRELARDGFRPLDFSCGFEELKLQLALRGLGNLREFRMEERAAYLHIHNACYHLSMVGLLQGSFESEQGGESRVTWEIGEDRSLAVEVKAAG